MDQMNHCQGRIYFWIILVPWTGDETPRRADKEARRERKEAKRAAREEDEPRARKKRKSRPQSGGRRCGGGVREVQRAPARRREGDVFVAPGAAQSEFSNGNA